MNTEPIHKFDTDVAIIGAGPVGLFTVFQCGMIGLKCHVIDILEDIGGQCSALYPEKPIYDIPAYPEISGQELVIKLIEQAAPFHPTYHLGQPVKVLSPIEKNNTSGWELEITGDKKITAHAVVIAGGSGAFGPVRLPLNNVSEFENKSLFYSVKNKSAFDNKNVIITGGGDSAVDWALELQEIASSISIVHRRNKFRAAPDSVRKMQSLVDKKLLTMIVPYQITGINGNQGIVDTVELTNLDGEKKSIKADVILAFFGLLNQLGPINKWGIKLKNNQIVVKPDSCATNLKGIFAVGDIATYPGKLKLILSGFSESALAAHAIYPLIYPDKELHFEYSTTKGIPK